MKTRTVGLSLGAVGLANMLLVAIGLPGWPCPLMSLTGFPCPGCGLSRAIDALMSGNIFLSLQIHAFAPIFLFAIVLLVVGSVLPDKARQWIIRTSEIIENRTGISVFVLIALHVYWLVRLLVFPTTYLMLVRN